MTVANASIKTASILRILHVTNARTKRRQPYTESMEDNTGTRFCDACASDCMGSGLFTDETEESNEG